MIKVLYNNFCSKSRAILEHLDENNVEFEIIDFIENPLSEIELKTVLKKLNTDVHGLIRKTDLGFHVAVPPVVAGETLYLVSSDGKLSAWK